jgi:hypothetical protein
MEAETVCPLRNAKHCSNGAEDWIGSRFHVSDGLKVVVVLLTVMKDLTVSYLVVGQVGCVRELDPHGGEEGEVICNEGDCIRT